jgi:hypothetical protein
MVFLTLPPRNGPNPPYITSNTPTMAPENGRAEDAGRVRDIGRL